MVDILEENKYFWPIIELVRRSSCNCKCRSDAGEHSSPLQKNAAPAALEEGVWGRLPISANLRKK
jgi:hypothetical protein